MPFFQQMARQRGGLFLSITSIFAIRSAPDGVPYAKLAKNI